MPQVALERWLQRRVNRSRVDVIEIVTIHTHLSTKLVYTTASLTLMLFRVALEYGQT
jgi:hypothetical protein